MEWYYILIVVLSAILLAILSVIVWYLQYITPIPTGRISENIAVIRTGIVNCFVYSKGSKKIMIDTGTSAKKLNQRLSIVGIEPQTITHIFLTHSDSDHIGGISLFDKTKLFLGNRSKVKNPENYHFLADGEIIDIDGIKVQAISTPGHRLGHTVYVIDEEFLFTGDALRLKKGVIKPFLRIISSDFKNQLKSIKKISQIKNISILFTAHNGFTTNFEKAIEDWKD